MNSTESCLVRLFRAAGRAEQPLPSEAPFWLEREILRAWQHGRLEQPEVFPLALARRAFVCACLILAVSAAISLSSRPDAPPNELVIVDSAIQLTLLQ